MHTARENHGDIEISQLAAAHERLQSMGLGKCIGPMANVYRGTPHNLFLAKPRQAEPLRIDSDDGAVKRPR